MLFEDHTVAFVVRIWLEGRESESVAPEWRGVIEHVNSGKRHYLRDLNEIPRYIIPYMEAMGIVVDEDKD
jgi:hypothetical protein